MKIRLSFLSDRPVVLPVGYMRNLQALIYNLIDKVKADWLHQNGFEYEKRRFKLFTYSQILEKPRYIKAEKKFVFPQTISFYISSPVNWILEEIARNSLLSDRLRLGANMINLNGVEVCKQPVIDGNKIIIKTLTPIEVHSTLVKSDGTKKTYYYSPREKEFSELINLNLKKKWEAFHKKEMKGELKIYPVNFNKCKERVLNFKGIIIKGWSGHFFIEGDVGILKFTLDVGLGSRNSAGFGMIDIVKRRTK